MNSRKRVWTLISRCSTRRLWPHRFIRILPGPTGSLRNSSGKCLRVCSPIFAQIRKEQEPEAGDPEGSGGGEQRGGEGGVVEQPEAEAKGAKVGEAAAAAVQGQSECRGDGGAGEEEVTD